MSAWPAAARSWLPARARAPSARSPRCFASRRTRARQLIGSARAGIAEARILAAAPDTARAIADEAVSFCDERGLFWDLAPWLAASRARIASGDASGASNALDAAAARIAQTGARAFEPFLHEARAAWAGCLGDTATRDDELDRARKLFAQLGAHAKPSA